MIDSAAVRFALEPDLDVAEFRRVLVESGLGTIRPVDDEARLRAMLAAADLLLTARPGAVGFYEKAGMERVRDAFWYRREH